MVAYADTSFLLSLYGQDANSALAQRMAESLHGPLVLTPLLRHEARNAARLALFRKEITTDECANVLGAIESDIRSGALVESPVAWADVYAEAEALSASHTGKLGLRASDALHVAMAVVLGVRDFYTFDARQKTLALKAGLKVKP